MIKMISGKWPYQAASGKMDTIINRNDDCTSVFIPTTEWAKNLQNSAMRELNYYCAVERFKKKMGLL